MQSHIPPNVRSKYSFLSLLSTSYRQEIGSSMRNFFNTIPDAIRQFRIILNGKSDFVMTFQQERNAQSCIPMSCWMDLIFQYYLAHIFQQDVCKTVRTMKVKMVGNDIKNKVIRGDLNVYMNLPGCDKIFQYEIFHQRIRLHERKLSMQLYPFVMYKQQWQGWNLCIH